MICLRDKSAVYRPRQPLESDFHRLFREHFADFRAAYGQRFAARLGHWRPAIDKAIHAFRKCGDLHHGFARVRCPDCRHEFFVAFSCKQRCVCPSCHQKRTILFGLHVAEDVCLPVPHRQFVWTIPKRLRIFFRFHRGLLGRLPALAWQTVLEVYRALLGDNATPGAVLAVQTFGQLLHFHPHIHALVTDGAFTPDGRFLPLPDNLTHEPFLRLWENKVFDLLLAAGRIEPATIAQIRSWRHSGFNVDRSVRLPAGDRDGVERLAQYMARGPFSLARLVRITPEGKVLYKAEKDHCQPFPKSASADLFAGVRRNFQVFEPLDFLAELTQHIPNKGEHLVRYYGYYSNKARGMRAKTAATPNPPATEKPAGTQHELPSPSDARRRWAMLIKKIYHADPLCCPRCGATMKIISFIEAHQEAVIERILRHCGLWDSRPKRAPPTLFDPGPEASIGVSPPAPEVDPDFAEYARREAAPDFDSQLSPFED